MVTPTLGAASATSITFSSTSGIIGTTSSANAAAGSVGELISSIINEASAISLTTVTPADLTSISLTAGDWDVEGNVNFLPNSTTNIVNILGWISTTSATQPDYSQIAMLQYTTAGSVVGGRVGFVVPPQRITISSPTTVYISVNSSFTISTLKVDGRILARRRR
jgi:hypothetical protein